MYDSCVLKGFHFNNPFLILLTLYGKEKFCTQNNEMLDCHRNLKTTLFEIKNALI